MVASVVPKTALTARARTLLLRRFPGSPVRIPLSRAFHQGQIYRNNNNTNTERSHLLPEFSLKDRVIVVSGGARGVGLTQAEALLEAGAVVHALDRLPSPAQDETSDFARVAARAASEFGGGSGSSSSNSARLTYHRVDVRDQKALGEIVGGIAEKEGRLDGLIAAAGIQQETPALEYTAEDADRMLGVNVTGVFMTAQAVAREMIKRGQKGSMVLIGSMSGTVANRGLICPAYNASKAAVLQLARNLAAEWGEHGIRVNSLSPGYIVTAMTASLFEAFPERRTAWPDANMLKRLSYPEEYRGAAVFLLSDASSFMTGADLRIDGGHCAW
ncbi:Hydroxynaphthalene reductase-like protein Arp2 [Madurella fahalii]|uniref:Hydroxynaphthalene reductase-like protein Arp2 n=1 Tax=Madurella fahalii TaxID=1157608 RepID=A0ABQ0FXI7_9PEZI